jgi:hypothetical protein
MRKKPWFKVVRITATEALEALCSLERSEARTFSSLCSRRTSWSRALSLANLLMLSWSSLLTSLLFSSSADIMLWFLFRRYFCWIEGQEYGQRVRQFAQASTFDHGRCIA